VKECILIFKLNASQKENKNKQIIKQNKIISCGSKKIPEQHLCASPLEWLLE
jgi:hypothetical protein